MCGISGAFNPRGLPPEHEALVARFGRAMRHRGPDDEGLFSDGVCALGHRRLAIIDLSRDGRQPFVSPDGRHQMVFNGEIFNYIELRQELAGLGWAFRTRTDTEVLLAAFLHWGPDCLRRLNGMFAFAVYDSRDSSLFLARDRMGVKPLYYARQDETLFFASETKALLEIPGLSRSVDQQALFDFLVFNRTDVHDETFLESVRRIPKGCRATADASGLRTDAWWDPRDYLGKGTETDPKRAALAVEELFVSAARLRMRSDVPVGSCLSGGLDSSVLTGVLFERLEAPRGYPCFTAAYPGHPVDETGFVDALNRRFPFASLRTFPTGAKALADLHDFVRANDEPTTGPSFYAQYEVMRLARQHGVTVLLDGQGGDESFAGYQYFHGFNLYGLLRRLKLGRFTRELWHVLTRRQHLSAVQTLAFQALPGPVRKALLHKASPLVDRGFFEAHIEKSRIYREFFAVKGLNESLCAHFRFKLEHLLRMEDRNSMAFSLEARVPYLDYRLVEYCLGLPEELKIDRGETKLLQKRALGRYTIPEILGRKDKLGFATPAEQWMAEPGWRALTARSFEDVRRLFPGVIDPAARPPAGAEAAWKTCQLAAWRGIFAP
ncbi:Asparagine synthetase [glutamine-hydrolyzing] 1 [Fundidesulfovibrio magnetotacticus]|uniref:asparagine synthase (glutamine-hydrolyzing) n=1 Tax=Fundidesulfovibrio magnetotacticus TaxID=2730080 RepID=A0A6V8LVS7_9BACT|nr:asparagine synthase (glutamine-hydrolyzing) [Fundidesulfovibrio magnetotacticus]GFK94189.1 Asparagine synthetase [glutamine-hydrolyzing] 1 [Fundidesulfovibrio magnetotacticus]